MHKNYKLGFKFCRQVKGTKKIITNYRSKDDLQSSSLIQLNLPVKTKYSLMREPPQSNRYPLEPHPMAAIWGNSPTFVISPPTITGSSLSHLETATGVLSLSKGSPVMLTNTDEYFLYSWHSRIKNWRL